MVTIWLVITRKSETRQSAENSKNVSQVVDWIIIFRLKTISRKNLFWLARIDMNSREVPFWHQKSRNFSSRQWKCVQIDVFHKMQKNGDSEQFSRIFPIFLIPIRIFGENFVEKSLSYKAGEFFVVWWGGGSTPTNRVPVKTAPLKKILSM